MNIPASETIYTDGLTKKYRDLDICNSEMCKEIRRLENKLVNIELANRCYTAKVIKLTKLLHSAGYNKNEIENAMQESENDDNIIPGDAGEETSKFVITINNL